MDVPTAEQVMERSQVRFGRYGYDDSAKLQPLVNVARQYIEWVTGQTFAAMPAQFEEIAALAVVYKSEVLALQSREGIPATVADFSLIQSFSAGPYSETRRSPADLRKAGMIDADPRLHSLFWTMLTDARRDDWIAWLGGAEPPAFAVTTVDWDNDLALYGAGRVAGGYDPADPFGTYIG